MHKSIAALIAVVLIAGAAYLFVGARDTDSAPGDHAPPSTTSDPGSHPAQTLSADDIALAKLETALRRAEEVADADAQRLERARAWVTANRPAGRAHNELEARLLALFGVMVDGGPRSAEWTLNMAQAELEMVRAIDMDADGTISPDDVKTFITEGFGSVFDVTRHPYHRERYDINGDGELDDGELAAIDEDYARATMSGTIERARLNALDVNHDGFVGEDEEREIDDAAIEVLVGAMLLTEWRAPASSEADEMAEEIERVLAEYQSRREYNMAAGMAYGLRRQFDHITSQHDTDGDGVMSEDEWTSRVTELLVERERRLFLVNYDLDGSGRVDAGELDTFLSWYGAGSLRADVNLDGRVDRMDLEAMVIGFESQNP